MGFADLLGQDNARRILPAILASGRLAPSYLFYGPEGVGQEQFAAAFVKGVFCPEKDADFCDASDTCLGLDCPGWTTLA